MRLHISICDDELDQSKYLAKLVREWDFDVHISVFDSAESLLFQYNNDIDVLLLDIQMKAMDGIALARELRKRDARVQLLFITAFPDYIACGYDVDALHYLMKPVQKEKLFDVLDRAIERLEKPAQTVLIHIDGDAVRLKISEIIYAEAVAHYVVIYTETNEYRTRMGLSELETLLGNNFFRCQRSFLVGMKYVRRVSREAMILLNGTQVPLSRKLYDEANRAFIEYE